ncbi:sensor histidine kinase [Fontibacillus sp. BL9]|uniref:sensor histidine kinase n=1 Tax=Fontibacillus sp. BL9 TaxID=3389971 RepID=UPI00397D990E
MTFTRKTMLLITAVIACILIVINSLVFVLYRDWSARSEQRLLQAQLNEVKQRITNVTFLPSLLHPGRGLKIFQPDLDPLESSLHEGQRLQLIDKHGDTLAKIDRGMSGEAVLKAEQKVSLPAYGTVTLEIAEDRGAYGASVRQVGTFLFLGTVLGIVLTCFSSYIIAKRTIAPVRQIAERVRDMDEGLLTERLELPKQRDEIYVLADTFNQLLERIHAGVERQKQFISDASHELKTPLSIIEGHAKLLTRWGKEKPEVLEESLGYILAETARIQLLSQQLLMEAELEERPISVGQEWTDLAELLQQIVDQGHGLYPEVELAYDRSEGSFLVGVSSVFLQQVLQNIVINALKYTPEGGRVHVTAFSGLGEIAVRVTDTGIGIPFEDQPRVFERFYRVDPSRSRSSGGTGLGLAIVKKIMDRIGGMISLESTPGLGTTVNMTFPKAILNPSI